MAAWRSQRRSGKRARLCAAAKESTHITDGLLGLLLHVPGLLNSLLDVGVELRDVRLQRLLGVEETGLLIRRRLTSAGRRRNVTVGRLV